MSLSAASRAIASVGPRPMVTRLSESASRSRPALQSSAAARREPVRQPVDRGGQRLVLGPPSGQSEQRRERGHEASWSPPRSSFAAGRHRKHDIAGARERALDIVDQRGRQRARPILRNVASSIRSSLRPDWEMARNSWSLSFGTPVIDGGDTGRCGRNRNSQAALDQVLAEGCRMGRAAARAGHHDLRGRAAQPIDEFPERAWKRRGLPPHGLGSLPKTRPPSRLRLWSWTNPNGEVISSSGGDLARIAPFWPR